MCIWRQVKKRFKTIYTAIYVHARGELRRKLIACLRHGQARACRAVGARIAVHEAIAMDKAASLGRTHRGADGDVLVQVSDGVLLAR